MVSMEVEKTSVREGDRERERSKQESERDQKLRGKNDERKENKTEL